MAKRIIWIVVAVIVVVGLYYWWTSNHDAETLSSGGVFSHDTLGNGSKSAMDRGVVSGSDIDGKPTDADSYGGAVTYDNKPPAPKPATATAGTGISTVNSSSASPQAVSQAPVVMPGSATTAATSSAPSSLPVSDTLTPNAPNGMAFGGGGKFQWYRQGNITWRINTQSGDTCIAFATMDEWQKPIVYTHGCGNA
jgi:hypothetical protein